MFNDKYMNRMFYDTPADMGGGNGEYIGGGDYAGDSGDNKQNDFGDAFAPKTRFERFLAKIAGAEDDIEPRTRIEYFLNMIAEHVNGSEDSDQTELATDKT